MKPYLLLLAAPLAVLLLRPVRAVGQCAHFVYVPHTSSHRSGPADTTTITERNNRWGLRMGLVAVRNQQPLTFGGVVLEAPYSLGRRVQLGVRLLATMPSGSSSSFGYDTGRPLLELMTGGLATRYQLLNGQRWRVEALGELGAGYYLLTDKDHLVRNSCGCEEPANLARPVRPLADAGLGLTYKLTRQFWLSSAQRGRAQLLGAAPLGAAGLQGQWQWTVAATMPSGR